MAVVTFTTTSAEDAQMFFAVGRTLGLTNPDGTPRDANGPEVKAYWIGQMKLLVQLRRTEEITRNFIPPTINPS